MSKAAFDKIAEGLTEALAMARGEAVPARPYVPRAETSQKQGEGADISQAYRNPPS